MNAANIIALPVVLTLAACALAGCQSPPRAPAAEAGSAQSTRNNCYSLLHQVLEQEKDASILRFIKPEHIDVRDLIKRISSASATGSALLEECARRDPTIVLDDFRLPPAEVEARAAIASARKKELLTQTGEKFELTLLLTQTEALSYAWHMAKVAGANEPQPEHSRALAGVSGDMQSLYQEVFRLLLSKTEVSATNQMTGQK